MYHSDIEDMIVDCENREHKLTAWEHDFITSIGTQFRCNLHLSNAQVEKLEEIWERVTK